MRLFSVLSPWMKKGLKGKCFAYVEEVKQKKAKTLKGIKINEFRENFQLLAKMEASVGTLCLLQQPKEGHQEI